MIGGICTNHFGTAAAGVAAGIVLVILAVVIRETHQLERRAPSTTDGRAPRNQHDGSPAYRSLVRRLAMSACAAAGDLHQPRILPRASAVRCHVHAIDEPLRMMARLGRERSDPAMP